MSERYAEAVASLGDEQHFLRLLSDEGFEGDPETLVDSARHAVQRAQALALLALAEELEALVELLRERLPAPAAAPVVHYRAEFPTSSPPPPDPGVRTPVNIARAVLDGGVEVYPDDAAARDRRTAAAAARVDTIRGRS